MHAATDDVNIVLRIRFHIRDDHLVRRIREFYLLGETRDDTIRAIIPPLNLLARWFTFILVRLRRHREHPTEVVKHDGNRSSSRRDIRKRWRTDEGRHVLSELRVDYRISSVQVRQTRVQYTHLVRYQVRHELERCHEVLS